MNYWDHLKRKYLLYIISGTILGVAVFSSVMVQRYDNYLTSRIENLEMINRNRHKIEKQINDTVGVVTRFRNEFNLDAANVNADAHIYQALDKMKAYLKNADVTIGATEDYGDNRAVPVDINMPLKDYTMLVNNLQYMESFRMPKFKILQFSIEKSEFENITLSIQGKFLMPSL